MNSTTDLKTAWTWEAWQQSRQARRAVTDRITPASVRRTTSSSDKRLRAAFNGQRGPDFRNRP
ncbi:MAG: hypothetical protein O3A51_12905 [Verrucomicrobia bacterium]|nr:hypothetical protein [Verrucomicrobiota bacterium]